MNNLLEDAAARLSVDVDALVAGGLARGRRLRRRRQVAAGLGSVAAVAVFGAGAVWAGHSFGSSGSSAGPADSLGAVKTVAPRAPETHTVNTGGDIDAPLALDAGQIHQTLAGLLPAGQVGPILTQDPYPVVSKGTDRIEHFTFDGSLVSFIISAAAGQETCESFAANADPQAGFRCSSAGGLPVLTEQTTGSFALNSATVWKHGYEITLMSYAAGPSGQANPAMDGKKMQHVADQPPLSLDVLTAAASSDAWFTAPSAATRH